MDREQLMTFMTVVEQQSFERAAAVLNVSRSAVSQRVKTLEEKLGCSLLVRDHPVHPTWRGDIVVSHVKALQLLELATAEKLNPHGASTPVPVSIAVNADSLATWLPSVLWSLLRTRRLVLEVIPDAPDHTVERLVRGEVLGCISTQPMLANRGYVAEPLGVMEYRCVATPAFVEQHFPTGLVLAAVLETPAVCFNRKDSLHDEFLLRRFGVKVERYAKHYLPVPGALLNAVLAGVGYGLVPTLQVDALGVRSQLVELAPDVPMQVPLYWHRWAAESDLLSEVSRLVVEEARRALQPSVDLAGSASTVSSDAT